MRQEPDNWVIYTLHDPRDPAVVRYVGYTIDPSNRVKTHIQTARNGRDKSLCGDWKRSLLAASVVPVFVEIQKGHGPGWQRTERSWISYFRGKHGDRLTNQAAGGGGVLGLRWQLSAETRARQGAAAKRRGSMTPAIISAGNAARRGQSISAEHKNKIRAANTGRKKSPEVIEKTAAFWRGRKHKEESREKMRAVHAALRGGPVKEKARSPEERARTSAALKRYYENRGGGRQLSSSAKEKISAALKLYRSKKTQTIKVDGQEIEAKLSMTESKQTI